MSVNGTHNPFAGQMPQRQGQDALNTDLPRGGQGGDRSGTQARQDRFGHAMAKAMATARRPELDDRPDRSAVAAVPLSPLMPTMPMAPDMPVTPAQRDATGIAERIERYLRGAEGSASLRQGEAMVVKLPGNAMGVTQVALRLDGEMLVVSLSMQTQAAAAQMAMLGQTIQTRTRHTVRLEMEGGKEVEVPEDAPFNPLVPRGRQA